MSAKNLIDALNKIVELDDAGFSSFDSCMAEQLMEIPAHAAALARLLKGLSDLYLADRISSPWLRSALEGLEDV